jgi:hypothetical protein
MLWSQFSAIFANFLAKKMAFFLTANVIIKFLQKSSSSLIKKRQYFRGYFSAKIFLKS